MLPGFSWPNWARSQEARRLRHESGAVKTASIRQLGKLVTTIVRADRFSDGIIVRMNRGPAHLLQQDQLFATPIGVKTLC